MADYTITLTDTNIKALDTEIGDISFFIQNFINVRAEKVQKRIIALLVEHCNANDITIATGVTAQIQQAYDLNLTMRAVDRAMPEE